jgi:hypothetical protein
MPEDNKDFDNDLVQDLSNIIEDEINRLGDLYIDVSRNIYIQIELDNVEIEYGYYDGVRFHPKFSVYFYTYNKKFKWKKIRDEEDYIEYEVEYMTDNIEDMVLDEEYTTFTDVLLKYLYSLFETNISHKLLRKQENKVEKYFNKVNDIFAKFLTPYTVGWCSSKVTDR